MTITITGALEAQQVAQANSGQASVVPAKPSEEGSIDKLAYEIADTFDTAYIAFLNAASEKLPKFANAVLPIFKKTPLKKVLVPLDDLFGASLAGGEINNGNNSGEVILSSGPLFFLLDKNLKIKLLML